jgi:sugar/nucleoside kinase (ribokinase family)
MEVIYMNAYDVYAYGMISTSTLHILETSFPRPDGYAEIKNTYRMIGGEAANSSIVLSRLGVRVRLDGNWLGDDENGRMTLKILSDFRIDTQRLPLKQNYRGVEEIVFADGAARTIFGTYCNLLFTGKQWNDPVEEDIMDAKIVCLDPFFKDESILAARMCAAHKKPYVTIDCRYTDEIIKNTAAVIISDEFRKREYPEYDRETLFPHYTQNTDGLVILTSGSEAVIYGRKDAVRNEYTPYRITPIDTAGAGDSFRSGVIYGLLKQWPDDKTIEFAGALGAYICESFPGVLNCPTWNEITGYIKKNKEESR